MGKTLELNNEPLAFRMMPSKLGEFAGQYHILGEGKLLRRMIEADRLSSLIFYGPPGSGKSVLANIIVNLTKSETKGINAVISNVSEMREIIKEAGKNLRLSKRRTILFIDEIHRFNKLQQDALLPSVEFGSITIIGLTTENPFFSLTPALQSRVNIFEFKPLIEDELEIILNRAIKDKDKGFGELNVDLTKDAKKHLIIQANGDARKLLNSLEIGVLSTAPDKGGVIKFDIKVAEESIQKKSLSYGVEEHYDTISAFIKSMRGSDPDAAVYWLSKMLLSGEDPLFIARRILICASEDVGNADPIAIILANSAYEAVEKVGLPEARIILSQAAIYIATSAKSNASYMAINRASGDVKNGLLLKVPDYLKDASYKSAGKLGRGKGYKYPHDYPEKVIDQKYLTEDKKYYLPGNLGFEKKIAERLKYWQELNKKNQR